MFSMTTTSGLRHGEVGLGRHDQAKRLQLRRHLTSAFLIVHLISPKDRASLV
jgi:hypothetical protein